MPADIRQTQRLGISDQLTEHTTPTWLSPDLQSRLIIHTNRDELRKADLTHTPVVWLLKYPERCIPGARQLTRRLRHTLEYDLDVELTQQPARDPKRNVFRVIHELWHLARQTDSVTSRPTDHPAESIPRASLIHGLVRPVGRHR